MAHFDIQNRNNFGWGIENKLWFAIGKKKKIQNKTEYIVTKEKIPWKGRDI